MRFLNFKKLIIFFVLLITFFTPAIASVNQNAEISKIENELFGFDYPNNKLEERIIRLEKNIYGKERSGDLNNRLKKLSSDIVSEAIGLEIPPCEDTFKEKDEIADSNIEYPIVDEIEMKLFNQTYKNRDFHTRIVTIERELFGKIYDIDDYSVRMDRIKAEIMPEKLAEDKIFSQNRNEYFKQPKDSINSSTLGGLNSNLYSPNLKGYSIPYENYDSNNYYPQTTDLNEELAQLEIDTFGTEFSGDDTKTRIKRLNSVNKAKKSSKKYDSQKFQQRMSMAMEIGAMILMILAMVL